MSQKVLCVGGPLDGIEVEIHGPKYMPVSKEDTSCVYDLGAKDQVAIDEAKPTYELEWTDGPYGLKTCKYQYIGNTNIEDY